MLAVGQAAFSATPLPAGKKHAFSPTPAPTEGVCIASSPWGCLAEFSAVSAEAYLPAPSHSLPPSSYQ